MSEWSRAIAKRIAQLQQKKYRALNRQFLVEGPKLVEEALIQNRFPVHTIIGTEDFLDQLPSARKNIAFYSVTARELKKISSLKTPQGGLAVLNMPEQSEIPRGAFLIYLDELQNPGNLGAIFRSAEWFGVDGILIGEGTVDPFNAKVAQASMGSILRVPFARCSYDQCDELSENYQFVGADMSGTPIQQFTPDGPAILVIGNEGRGLSPEMRNRLQAQISIPQHPAGHAESLNAALSASIIMYAWSSQKNSPSPS